MTNADNEVRAAVLVDQGGPGSPLLAVVHKWPLPHATGAAVQLAELELPRDSVVLTAAEQRGDVVLWAVCDPALPRVRRRFVVLLTGQRFTVPAGCSLRYLATVLLDGGAFVEHVFEIEREGAPERWVPA